MSPDQIPSVAQNCGGGLRFLPVAEHELRAAHDEFAGLTGRRFRQVVRSVGGIDLRLREDAAVGRGDRVADGVGTIELGFKKADMGDGRGLGHAVSLTDQDVGECREAAGKIGSERRGSGFDPVNLVVAGKLPGLGRLAERIHGGRDERHHGDRFVDEQLRHHGHVEARYQNERCTQNQRRIENYIQAVDVVERKTAENMVGGIELSWPSGPSS